MSRIMKVIDNETIEIASYRNPRIVFNDCRIMKVIDNETIEIASYRKPRIVFNDYRYDDIERYCDFKATINPFVLYGENERLHNIIKEVREYINSNEFIGRIRLSSENKQAINKLLEILDKAGNSND